MSENRRPQKGFFDSHCIYSHCLPAPRNWGTKGSIRTGPI